jgi:hypothetical protein
MKEAGEVIDLLDKGILKDILVLPLLHLKTAQQEFYWAYRLCYQNSIRST